MRCPFGVLAAVGLAVGSAPAVDPPQTVALIARLGSPGFADREAASKELLALGASVGDLLEKNAIYHPDPEVRRRAAEIVRALQRRAESVALTPPSTIALDYAGVPLNAAIADLRKKTGIPLTLDPAAVSNAMRPITVRTGALPAWQAVDEFLRAAGLAEVFRDELPAAITTPTLTTGNGIRVANARPTSTRPPLADNAVLLRDGSSAVLPGDRSAGVRVVALPPGFRGNRVVRGAGQVVLNLDITPLPGLKWGEATTVRVRRAEDETGRPVTVSHRAEDPTMSRDIFGSAGMFGGAGQVVFLNDGMSYIGGPQATRPNPRIVPVVLKTDDRAVRSLRVLEGVVVGEVTVPNQSLMSLSDLPKAVGRSAEVAQGVRVTLLDYAAESNGRAILRVRTENPNPWTTMRLGRRQLFLQMDGGLLASGPAVQYRFVDAAGHILRPQTRNSSSTDDGVRQTAEVELVFAARPDIGPPTHLTVVGNKQVTVEVPFTLRNVPLP